MKSLTPLFAALLLMAFALLPACGESGTDAPPLDGDTDGDETDGDEPDGDTEDGDEPDGDPGDGDGDTPDGDLTDGDELDGDVTDGDEADGDQVPDPGLRLREEGWLRGDLHMHTKWSDGMDATAMVIAIAEYLENDIFLAAHPEYEGNGLDFISITDHRTVDVLSDPDWVSERLILIPGQEFGSGGHANIFGLTEFVSHDPGGDGVTLDDLLAAIGIVEEAQGVFSINHPMDSGNPWPWDTRTHTGLEICNTRWGMTAAPAKADLLENWENSRGPASPLFRRAVQDEYGQILRFYEAMLARDVHVALVGGSDRHMMFMIGFPTTWIKPAGPGSDGLVEGMRNRHTFVSRAPVAATIELSVQVGDAAPAMIGDAVPIPGAGAMATITARVGRAQGGLLRIIHGSPVETDEDLPEAELGVIIAEISIDSPDFVVELEQISVLPGEWIYPMVLEPIYAPGLTDEKKAAVDRIAAATLEIGSENYAAFAGLFLDYIDINLIIDPASCDAESWNPEHLQCLPLIINDAPTSTFYVPDWIDRALNAFPEQEGPALWCMGAIGSAIRFVE